MEVTLDERTRAALARLTANEKECLRRRLLPQTAKEMAIDLGVSPHAIEKRLKMARTKLGLGSSLEVARMLAVVEGEYERPVPEKSGLAPGAATGSRMRLLLIITGIALMSLIAAAMILLAPAQDSPKVSFEDATAYLEASFDRADRDKSGFLDAADTPRIAVKAPEDTEPRAVGDTLPASFWISKLDADGDGKVSRAEYIAKLRPGIMERGIPTPPSGSR
ncbi:MAG: EF-hand domain-containing protein [Sphingomonas sp.]|uniref:EF-hand domain-containing protein n=1 Tax=Sphingomonas sp. TaxID=28214 RepID=UPI0025F30F20|nr:EF-hand domain-containing protein [Sphingomonas sp.]MBX3565835.1 EF-hand domain-containing protein [Sphingomonas sp.]